MGIDLKNLTCCRMNNESCLYMNDVLWEYRKDLSTRPLIMAVFAFCYSVIVFFGICGNLCVVLAISRTRSLQTVPNMFIFSLSCSDIVVCFTSATITPITAFKKDWIFGSFLCSSAPFIAGVSLCFSTFTLAAISIDRFLLIRYPMQKPFNHKQASFAILGICILSMFLSAPTIFTQKLSELDKYCGSFCYEDWGSHQSRRRAYGTIMLTLQFIIPLSVIIICYTAISVRLGQSLILKTKKRDYEWQLQMTDQQRAANKRRQRTNRMFIGMVVAFSSSWFWSVLFNVLRDYEKLPAFAKEQEFFVGILTHCFAMTSTVWNPLLYSMLNLQLRAAFVQLMPECLKQYCCCSKLSKQNGLANEATTRRRVPTVTVINGNPNPGKGPCHTPLLLANEHALPRDDDYDGDEEGSLNNNNGADSNGNTKYGTLVTLKGKSASFCNFSGEWKPQIVDSGPLPLRASSTRRKESFGLLHLFPRGRGSKRRDESAQLQNGSPVGHQHLCQQQIIFENEVHDSRQSHLSRGSQEHVILLDQPSESSESSGSADSGYAVLRKTTPELLQVRAPARIRTTSDGEYGRRRSFQCSQKAAQVLGLLELDGGDVDDLRAVGWWRRRKSACECSAGDGPLRPAPQRLDVPEEISHNGRQLLGLSGVVKLTEQHRVRSLTRSAFELIGRISPHGSKHSVDTPRSPRSPRSPLKLFSNAKNDAEEDRLLSPDSSSQHFSFDQMSDPKKGDDLC